MESGSAQSLQPPALPLRAHGASPSPVGRLHQPTAINSWNNGKAPSPSLRQPSLVWPPTPSPVANNPHFANGWAGLLPSQYSAFQPTTVAGGDPTAMGQQQMVWVQMPVPMNQMNQMGMMMPTTAQMPLQAVQGMDVSADLGGANSRGQVAQAAYAPVGQVVQGEVCYTGVPTTGSNQAGKSRRKHDGEEISSAGKQLFTEAMDNNTIDNLQPHAKPEHAISGLTSGPTDSMGSSLHGTNRCSPCAWYWKPRGCGSARSCPFCHMCPEGELKRRKKHKIAMIKQGIIEPTHPRPEAKQKSLF